jgi:Pao retrotransposon peptidase
VLINAKALLQSLWKQNIGWDEELTGDHAVAFQEFVSSLKSADGLSVARVCSLAAADTRAANELHVFCDASARAYGCVVYVRSVDSSGRTNVSFVMSKARVSPVKITIRYTDWSCLAQ